LVSSFNSKHVCKNLHHTELVEQLNNTVTTMGSEVELRCRASVDTSIISTWKHNDTEMTNYSNHLSLMLHNVSLTDGGSYTCEITGNAGKPEISTAKLELLCMLQFCL